MPHWLHEPPPNQPLFVGHVRPALLPFVERSARQAINRLDKQGKGSGEQG